MDVSRKEQHTTGLIDALSVPTIGEQVLKHLRWGDNWRIVRQTCSATREQVRGGHMILPVVLLFVILQLIDMTGWNGCWPAACRLTGMLIAWLSASASEHSLKWPSS
jgi:hypothetical protein